MMIKKTLLICTIVMSGLLAVACEDEGGYEEVTNNQKDNEQSEYVFEYNLFEINIGAKWEHIQPKLGEYKECFVAESCAYQGTDRYYYYSGFEIMTSEIDGEELLTDIFIEGTEIKAVNGVYVGMSLSDMANAMGPADNSNGDAFIYYGGIVNVQINTKDDKVASVEYYYVQE